MGDSTGRHHDCDAALLAPILYRLCLNPSSPGFNLCSSTVDLWANTLESNGLSVPSNRCPTSRVLVGARGPGHAWAFHSIPPAILVSSHGCCHRDCKAHSCIDECQPPARGDLGPRHCVRLQRFAVHGVPVRGLFDALRPLAGPPISVSIRSNEIRNLRSICRVLS